MAVKLTLAKKVAVGFGVVVFVALAGSVVVTANFIKLGNNALANRSSDVLQEVATARAELFSMESAARAYAITHREGFVEDYNRDSKRVEVSIGTLEALVSADPEQRDRVSVLKSMFAEVRGVNDNWISARYHQDSLPMDAQQLVAIQEAKVADFESKLSQIAEAQKERARANLFYLEHLANNTQIAVIVSGMLTIAFSIGAAIVIVRGIVRTLGGEPREASDIAARISRGDLSLPSGSKTGAHRGGLVGSLELMRSTLRSLVQEIQTVSRSLALATSDISIGNADLSLRTEEQASSLEETASSMMQITEAVQQNAENARRAATLAAQATDFATDSDTAVKGMVVTIEKISGASAEVAKITQVIEGIAFQTNILALNAAVEAARAGLHGRGFAVVATEVRHLAQRSAVAAKEVKTLLGSSFELVKDGEKQAAQMALTMKELDTAISEVSQIVEEISLASDEQSQGIKHVASAMAQMDSVTQQNVTLVANAASAAQLLEAQGVKLNAAVSAFNTSGSD